MPIGLATLSVAPGSSPSCAPAPLSLPDSLMPLSAAQQLPRALASPHTLSGSSATSTPLLAPPCGGRGCPLCFFLSRAHRLKGRGMDTRPICWSEIRKVYRTSGLQACNTHSKEIQLPHKRPGPEKAKRGSSLLPKTRGGQQVTAMSPPCPDLIIQKLINRRNGRKQIHTHLNNDTKSENTISFFFNHRQIQIEVWFKKKKGGGP